VTKEHHMMLQYTG